MIKSRSTLIARAALLLTGFVCTLCPIWFALAALGSKWGWWDWRFGLGVMTREWGPLLAWVGIGASLTTSFLWIRAFPRWGAGVALLLGLAPATMLAGLRHQQSKVLSLPAVYDVQTDWDRPISFSEEALAERNKTKNSNPVLEAPIVIDDGRRGVWAGMSFQEAQSIGYPDLKSLELEMSLDQAANLVSGSIDAAGLEISRSYRQNDAQFFEGTDRTFWYGLVDDYVIRIQVVGPDHTRIDMRSVSREGHVDLGENAKRIRQAFNSIQSRLTSRP